MPTGDEWSLLSRPDPFYDEKDADDPESRWTHQDHTETGQGSGELITAPVVGPTDHDQSGGQRRDPDRREIDTGRDRDPWPSRFPGPSLGWRRTR